MLYAHGGLVRESAAVQRVADYRKAFLSHEVFPLAFIWKTGYWSTLSNMLKDAFGRRRAEGQLDSTKDFMLDRLDDALEPLARVLTGKASWDEMKENALLSSKRRNGGASVALDQILSSDNEPFYKDVEIHIVAHSAGSIFMAPIIKRLAESGHRIASCTLWAPACTVSLFRKFYVPALESGQLERLNLFTLTDEAEQDDHCAHIYNKSLLYLVSHAFENKARVPLLRGGVPILGMAKTIEKEEWLTALFKQENTRWVQAPNHYQKGSPAASRAMKHGGFDDDEHTLKATLAQILNQSRTQTDFLVHRSAGGLQDRRRELAQADGSSSIVLTQ